MPLYQFDCLECGPFTAFRTIAQRDAGVSCPDCGAQASRILSMPNLSLMSSTRKSAHERNEKSRHEPRISTRHQCGSGCGCGTSPAGAKRNGAMTVEIPKLGKLKKQRKQKRPWMLGH